MPSTIPKSKVKLYPSPASGGGQNTHSTKKGTGTPAVKSKPKKKSAVSSSTTNSCDEKVCELDVPIQEKYKTQTRLGKGAYGIVWEAVEVKTGEKVALKKIFDAFRNNTDAQRTYREIFFLLQFGSHPNIISLTNVHRAQNDLDFYLCFPLMSTDLHKIVKSAPEMIGDERMRSILYQISKAILYIHSAGVIHRDIKPANILLDENLNAKLGDFGLARSVTAMDGSGDCHPELTDYVATRWYRPPEILLNSKMYSKSVDIWSLGCILAEMVKKSALFPGANTVEQIELVLGTIGKASRSDLDAVTSDSMRSVAQAAMQCRKPGIREIFVDQKPELVDFMEKILVFSPEQRPSIEAAIAHPLLRWNRCVAEEIRFNYTVAPPIDENVCYPLTKYRSLLYEMLENGELGYSQRTILDAAPPAGFKQDKIRKKRSKVSALTLQPKEIGVAEKGGSGDAWQLPSRAVDNDKSFHSLPDQSDAPKGKNSEGVKVSKRSRGKRVPKEKTKIPSKHLLENIKGTDGQGYLRTPNPKRKLLERLGTAPPNLQPVRSGESLEEYFSPTQARPRSRNNSRDSLGYLSISIPTADDDSRPTANKFRLSRPWGFKAKLHETQLQLESMNLGFRSLDSDIEKGGGDRRRPSTAGNSSLPYGRTTTTFPRITKEISQPFKYPNESLGQPAQSGYSTFVEKQTLGSRPVTSDSYKHGTYLNDSLFYLPEWEPQTSLSVIDDRPPSRSNGVRSNDWNRNPSVGEPQTTLSFIDERPPSRSSGVRRNRNIQSETRPSKRVETRLQEVVEDWTDPPPFRNPQRQSVLHPPMFEKPNNRKKPVTEQREKLRYSAYFPAVELNESRLDGRNRPSASISQFNNREFQRSRIAAKMNALPKGIGLSPQQESVADRTRKKSVTRPAMDSNPQGTRPNRNQKDRLATVIESKIPAYENYTKGSATISSKDLDDLKATFSRVGRY